MLLERLHQVSERWFKGSPRPFVEHAVGEMEKKWNEKNFFVIEAPTGYGKSTISATVALHSLIDDFKCIVAYPLRTLLEDQFGKFRNLIDADIAEKVVGKRYMHNYGSPYLIKPITLTTIDTLSLTLFGIPPEELEKVVKDQSLGHYLFSWASVVLSNLVLDEVHLLCDSTKSLSFLAALMRIAESFGQKVVFMSATLPKALKSKLSEVGKEKMEFISFDREKDREFCDERSAKRYDIVVQEVKRDEKFGKIFGWIRESEFPRILVVFNTVNEATEFYRAYGEKLREMSENVLLVHSRFAEEDREKKIERIRKLREAKEFIIVSTQVIEAGIDVTSDCMITDLAPANSLIQRFGRFLRYNEREGKIYVWFERAEKGYKVYDLDLALRTLDLLRKDKICVHLPDGNGYSKLIDSVYSEKDFRIDASISERFESVFLHLENASQKALEVFFEMEGSFVREGLQVPVAGDLNLELGTNFTRKLVPLPFEFFAENRGKISGAVVEEDGLKRIDASDKRLEFLRWKLTPQLLVRKMLRERIVAFLVSANYSPELGLVL